MGVMDDLARAREAFERREWAASYEALSRSRRPSNGPRRRPGRHLSNIFVKINVSSRTAAAAFAYEHGLV